LTGSNVDPVTTDQKTGEAKEDSGSCDWGRTPLAQCFFVLV
jgi:hypothetical protein